MDTTLLNDIPFPLHVALVCFVVFFFGSAGAGVLKTWKQGGKVVAIINAILTAGIGALAFAMIAGKIGGR